jgi:hypothetical protein
MLQIIEKQSTSHFIDGLPGEATIAAKVDHPGVLKTLAHEIEVVEPAPGQRRGKEHSSVVAWLITEFCDMGTLSVSPSPRFRVLNQLLLY